MLVQTTKVKKVSTWTGLLPKDAPEFYRAVVEDVWDGTTVKPRVEMQTWLGVKRTSSGWWVVRKYPCLSSRARWMSNHARKRFAWPTQEEAMESLIQRMLKAHERSRVETLKLEDTLRMLRKHRPDHPDLQKHFNTNPDREAQP